jgi:Flp pilus assembly protein TadG
MMRKKLRILSHEGGMGAVEFALITPVLLAFIVGVAQVGTLFFANSGLKSAVGEGARFATIHPRPSNAQIIQRITDKRFGLETARITGPAITPGTVGTRNFLTITMSYSVPLDFIFYSTTPITLTETRRVFVHPAT